VISTHDAVLDFRVPPQPHLSRVVREGVTDFARAHAVGEDDLAHFLTALGEAIANAIEHSHADSAIEVEIRIGEDRILATVHDSGVGFDTTLVVEPALPEPTAERGRGLPIMRRCSDVFVVKSEPGEGTVVVLGRYFRKPSERSGVA